MIHDLLECLNVAVLVRLCETARRVNVTPLSLEEPLRPAYRFVKSTSEGKDEVERATSTGEREGIPRSIGNTHTIWLRFTTEE